MISVASLLTNILIVAPLLLLGVYITVVLDVIVGRAVARLPFRPLSAVMLPIRQAALFALQQRTGTERSDVALWALAPALLAAVASASLFAIPLSRTRAFIEIDSGIVYFTALMALVMVAVFLNGWSANSLFPMIGGYRFIAQALSYEMPLALVLIGTALPAESLSVNAIVLSQESVWNVVRQPLGLPLYLIAGLGLSFWGPLAIPDAADLAGGTESELSGMSLLVWRVSRAAILVAVAAMGAAAFLGGWQGPVLSGTVWMVTKTVALLLVMITIGHFVGRVRLERFVVVAWAVLIPLALVDVFVSGILALE